MSITFDTAAGSFTNGANSLTWAHTCSGANRMLFVGVIDNNENGDHVTGVTYAGVSMTLVNKIKYSGADNRYTYLFSLPAPATGANNVVISASISINMKGSSSSYNGVFQGTVDSSTTASGPGTVTCNLTTVANNCWGIMVAGTTQDSSASTNFTSRNSQNSGNNLERLGDSNGVITPAGSFSMSVTIPGGPTENCSGVAASFAPALPFSPFPSHYNS